MLGLNRQGSAWRWRAIGKHPAAMDYFSLNSGTPLMDAIAEWVTKGYDGIIARGSASNGPYSWRFWFKGGRKGTLVCGVGRDSSDRIGRPYPLLLFGEGPLKGWEKIWMQLPLLLERTWMQIERLATQRFADLSELSDGLSHITPPQIEGARPHSAECAAWDPPEQAKVDRYRQALRNDGRVTVPLGEGGDVDSGLTALQWHGKLAACCPETPRAMFLGGHPRRLFLVLVKEPLSTADFIDLWSV
jgi:type VI secretion system ImpM family protein